MLTYEQALKRILGATPSPRMGAAGLDESLGLVLARPVSARCDLPPFDNSAVDGYAIRSQDLPQAANGPTTCQRPSGPPTWSGRQRRPGRWWDGHASQATWRIVGHAEAGRPFGALVRQGEAVRILTGAQVPQGADAVVMQEHATRRHHRLVVLRRPTRGQHIRRRGEDLRKGTRILQAGTRLRPQELGLLAAVGVSKIPVYPRPTVAILTTGDELQPPGTRLRRGRIYESNGRLLHALIRQAGAQAIDLGMGRDTLASLTRQIRRGLACDLLVISGGVSVGDKDLVRSAAQRCGVRPVFWQVSIKPGMPLFVGMHGRTMVFGLPGNPVSVFVTFEEFVKPALYRLMGREWRDPYTQPAVIAEDLQVSLTRRTHFLRVRCSRREPLVAEPLEGQGSHRLRSLVEADGWIRMNAEQGPWPSGARVLVKREERDT